MRPSITKPTVAVIILVLLGITSFAFLNGKRSEAPVLQVPTVEVGAKREVIGLSVEKRNIESYTYGSGDTHLAFVGGIHGGYEWNSVLLAYEFIDYLNADPTAVPDNLTLTIIPSANPDGVYKVVGKEGRFAIADVSTDRELLASARFNARQVDLNRNFDCRWQPESTWRQRVVSAGTGPFSEPESKALRDFILETKPDAVIFWHSQANAVYASECGKGILPETLDMMNIYAKAAGYQAIQSFDSYPITGDIEGWLASKNIPAITVELKTHQTVEWPQNLAGIKALFTYYSPSI
ncbi:MAG: M14 family metallopeptidase [Parcubacteria group bacterium]